MRLLISAVLVSYIPFHIADGDWLLTANCALYGLFFGGWHCGWWLGGRWR